MSEITRDRPAGGGRSLAVCAFITVALLGGCGGRPSYKPADPKAFDSAPAEAKALWDGGQAALQTNGVVAAYLQFRLLRGQSGLSPEQISSVDAECRKINETLAAASLKGDQAAKDALQEIRSSARTRAR
jgi:hypothetical protein